MTTNTATVHRLKVTLRTVKPPVWRRIEVPSTVKLSQLAAVLEAAMGWLGGHLHSFEAGDVIYELPDEDGFGWRTNVDERRAKLDVVLPSVGSKMRWDYDFGDGWQHNVVVEAIEPKVRGVKYPICTTGKRACPPDDCGGPWGYANLLEAIADPAHLEHDELVEWLPPGFDPAAFSPAEATLLMHQARPFAGW